MGKIYIDCSDLIVDNTNTGIRRVERNLIKTACKNILNNESPPVPVINLGSKLGLLQIEFNSNKNPCNSFLEYFYTVYFFSLRPNKLKNLSKAAFPSLSIWLELYWKRIRFILLPVLLIILPILSSLSFFYILFKKKIKLLPGDIYFIPGSTWWSKDITKQLNNIKKSNISFGILLHDLIPVDYPQYCNEKFANNFNSFLPKVLQSATFVICISKYTEKRLHEFLNQKKIKDIKTDINYSGFKLDRLIHETSIREDIFFTKNAYITIGTIEPRKNYSYLLDAFDLTWQNNITPTLCIIGKYGWKSECLVERILSHSQYGKRLFWFNDLNDNELLYAYQHAKACVYPSIVEGFGLPLIEALSLKCPVLASDIPIFHEVGGDYCHYFSLESPSFLFELIQKVEEEGLLDNLEYLKSFRWPDWNESTTKLLGILTSLNNTKDS